MKKIFSSIFFLILFSTSFAQTGFIPTTETFKNGEVVLNVEYNKVKVGQFWPIHGMNLITNQTDKIVTTGSLEQIQASLGAVATAPDGMTEASLSGYVMEGMALSNGRPCGDGLDWDYGVVVVEKGFHITFTHHREHNMDSLFRAVQARKGTMFYLPAIKRNGNETQSVKLIDKVLIRRNVPITRETPDGVQMGILLFDSSVTCVRALEIVKGLDRKYNDGRIKSQTTHAYVLDGGPHWGQSCKEVNGKVELVGTRDTSPIVNTNYLVLY